MVNLRALTDSLVRDYARFEQGSLMILYDGESEAIGKSIFDSAQGLVPAAERIVAQNIDVYREQGRLMSLRDDLRDDIAEVLQSEGGHNIVLYTFHPLPHESKLRKELHMFAGARGKIGGLPHCTVDVLEAGFHPENRAAFTEQLYDFVMREHLIHMTCDRGSDLRIEIDEETYTAVQSNGVLPQGKYANPVPAEVFVHPLSGNGVAVITGSYGPIMNDPLFEGNLPALVATLDKNPLIWTIEDGSVVDVVCDDKYVESFARQYIFESDPPHSARLGEFGLPANLFVLARKLTGNLMIDEKGRVHAAHGHGYLERTGATYDTTTHGDGLIACATLKSARLGKTFMVDNVYDPSVFSSLR